MLTGRQEEILNWIIKDYIELAEPISSELLDKKHKFKVSPATIRIEFQKLTKKGYLYQPHTSAGRVPTDKGYRFFVDNLFKSEISEFKDVFEIEQILRETRKDILKWANQLTKFLAEESSNFVILHFPESNLFWKEGWEEVFEEPEFEEKNIVFDFFKLLEEFEESIEDLKLNSGIKVYIGRENPLPRASNFSLITSKCRFPDEEEGIISLLGPKRMDYDRNIALIHSFKKILDKF